MALESEPAWLGEQEDLRPLFVLAIGSEASRSALSRFCDALGNSRINRGPPPGGNSAGGSTLHSPVWAAPGR
jgi:hypothetical protein